MTGAEEYSFNIESHLFHQLTIEQQALWRNEIEQAYNAGAEWQKRQLEKNRLAACDQQSEEDAQRESDFVISLIEREHRHPTFDDAIKYGYHQAIADACEWIKQQQEMLEDCFSDAGDFADLLKQAMDE